MEKIEKARKFMELFKSTQDEADIYMVGGAVRDMVLGIDPDDIDFAVPYPPEGTKKILMEAGLFKRNIDMKDAAVGVVVVSWEDETYEITTFRAETYTPGNRRPEVKFAYEIVHPGEKLIDIDARRRDFNINSLYWDGEVIYDPMEGLRYDEYTDKIIPGEINKVLRTNISQDESYKQDPLRILRALRFAQKYSLLNGGCLRSQMGYLVNLSPQTARKEIEKGFRISEMFRRYDETGVFELLIPFYQNRQNSSWWPTLFDTQVSDFENWATIMVMGVSRPHFSNEDNATLIRKSLTLFRFSKEDIEKIMVFTGFEKAYLKDDWTPGVPLERLGLR